MPGRPSFLHLRHCPQKGCSFWKDSLGVYSTDLTIPLGAFAAGLGNHQIVTTLCPGGKKRMRRLMNTIHSGRVDFQLMVTHRFKLDDIEAAYDLFGHQRDGVLKVAISP
jgi:alcohol dehydrogenase